MAGPIYADRVKDTSSTTGTGSLTLAGSPPTGSQSFATVGDGNTCYYCAYTLDQSQVEVGLGTYSTSGPTLARNTVAYSTNGNAKVNFSAALTVELVAASAFFTAAQAAEAVFVGDSGGGGVAGVVPAPASGDAAALKVLGAGGSWITPLVSGTNIKAGTSALNIVTTGTDNLAIGNSAQAANISFIRNIAIGNNSLAANNNSSDNIAIGVNAMANTLRGSGCIAIGTNTLFSQTDSTVGPTHGDNLAIGYNALYSLTTSVDNFAIGSNSLYSCTTGNGNLGIGVQTLYSCVGGAYNLAICLNALYSLTSGSYNIGLGQNALNKLTTATNCVAIGFNALAAVTTNSSNTAIGDSAAYQATGGYNTIIGASTAQELTTGEQNTFVGWDVGRGVTTGRANTIIGAYVIGLSSSLSNNIIISDGDGYIGLQVNNTGKATFRGPIKLPTYTIAATLPAAATAGAGARCFVSDALTPVFGATVSGGGAAFTPVYSNGTDWKVG